MKVCVTTCDQYLFLMEVFPYFFNKYWSETQEIDLLCYKKPEISLPPNFNIVSLGCQKDFGRACTTALIPYFESM